MTIVLVVNNTFGLVFPIPNIEPCPPPCPPPCIPTCPQEVPCICLPQPRPKKPFPTICCIPCADQTFPYKRNVIENIKQCLDNAFNFIDFRKVLTEDEVHHRDTRSCCMPCCPTCGEVIPGILLYPKKYGPHVAKCGRDVKNVENSDENSENQNKYYYYTSNSKGTTKYKRSLQTKKSTLTEADIAAEEAQLEIEKKQSELEKEMTKDLNLDKEVVEALSVGSTPTVSPADEQVKKDEEYLEKENREMIHNEQLLEGPDVVESSDVEVTEHTCVFTEPLITEEIEPITSATDSILDSAGAVATAIVEGGGFLEDPKSPESQELEETDDNLTQPPVEICEDCCPPEEPCEPPPCRADDEPCPPPCPTPCPCLPCHIPTSDEIIVNQTDLTKSSKTKSIAEFEDEMRGIVSDSASSAKQSFAIDEKRKGVFDITPKAPKKNKKKRKLRQRCCRKRRDLMKGGEKASTAGWKDVTTTAATTPLKTRDVGTETTELVKVTRKEITSPVAVCEEVEDVTEVLFTTKPDQEQMEMECNEVKGGEHRAPKTTTQKLGEPVTIVITKSTEPSATTSTVPSALSEYIQTPYRDENDEAVTETLNRLLRDLRLVNQVQNILQGIKETGYEIHEAVKRRSVRPASNTGRKLASMEVHQKAAETTGLKKFRKRTYRRRTGDGFKRYSRNIDVKEASSPVDQMLSDGLGSDQLNSVEESVSNKKKRRWKDYAGNWVEWIPNVQPFLEPNYQNYQF